MTDEPPAAAGSGTPASGLLRRVLPGAADLRHYRPAWVRRDLLAGLAVWAVLVPQGLAYGELAGLSPVTGLYTAIGALLLYALVGSSRYLHTGPESSVAIVTAAYLGPLVAEAPERAADLASLLAFVTAGFLVLGAVLRLGVVARLLSTPVLAGYLTGSAVVIAASQLGKIFAVPTPDEAWWRKVAAVVAHLAEANPYAVTVGAGSLLCAVAVMRWTPRVPAILVAIAGATALVAAAGWEDRLPVVGYVPPGVPPPSLPRVRAEDAVDLLAAGGSVALLVFASSMLTATALARRDRETVSPRREFLGYAAASLGSGLMQGYPANGSDSRSFVVADSGGRTQVANVTAAGLVAVTLIVLTPVFRYLPQAALGAVVLLAAVRMIDLASLRRLWKARRSDFVLAAVTMVGVLVVGVLPGIAVGVAVSLLEVLRRAVLPPTAVLGRVAGHATWRGTAEAEGEELRPVPGLLVYRFDAPLFFANADVLRTEIVRLVDDSDQPVRTVVLNAEGMVDMDITGAETLAELVDDLAGRGTRLVMARVRRTVRMTMQRLGVEERVGTQNIHLTVRAAVRAGARSETIPGG
ncbi:SulP family inorganic anion transporter [Blastococcus sp. CT_GayMR20]|uniref:SulP family inorganic anion transporter n=1 Tax=Blastococcus sp. CT_GayMR20 TaxID=2559609 RepID=UPI00107493E2|nr:SulP family inorganic anion transporter [Blastococcus sp. CT_GayMR20]TFV92959.1 SulP family inorganic anion transporter [Blastococcus sp. CT_GayMR20]